MKSKSRLILAGLVLLALLSVGPARAHSEPEAAFAGQRPGETALASLLAPNGTLNLPPGFSGSVDATGWRLASGAGEEPRFTRVDAPPQDENAPTIAGDEWWDDQFMLGADNSIYTIAVSGSKVYVGGDIDKVGGISASQVACWDSATHTWSALGKGVNSRVWAIAAHGDDVYVGGGFTQAGGNYSAKYIAHWNAGTHTWSAMGSAMTMTTISPDVRAIAVAANGDVYVGGQFETVGGVNARNIARWDGSAWHALSSGVFDGPPGSEITSEVKAVAVSGSDVYVGGEFSYAGGMMAHNVAHWNGSTWSSLGGGTGGTYDAVDALVLSGSNVYIGGRFDEVTDSTNGTQAVGHVAMWNGAVWNTLAGGVGDPDVAVLAVGPDGIYVGGRFTKLADNTTDANRIARWDGASWSAVGETFFDPGGGVDSNVYGMAYNSVENSIYVSGHLETAGGRQAGHVGRWSITDSEWYALGNSVNGPVYALLVDEDDIYLGGSFNSAGGIAAHGMARWNSVSQTWATLDGGMGGCSGLGCTPAVYALTLWNGDIYAGGNFTSAGGVAASRIARWNPATQNWSALGSGVFGCTGLFCAAYVRSICPSTYYGLIVGGSFDNAGSFVANNVATWNGSAWDVLGSGANDTVYAIANPSSATVYIGGSFTSPSDYIAKWDGAAWSSLNADPVNGVIYTIEPSGYYLFVGGSFTNLGGPNGDHITAFYSSDWHQLDGDGLDNVVYALEKVDEGILVGGDFISSGILGLSRVAFYNYSFPSSWNGYGSGADVTVRAMASSGRYLYAGGSFLNAGGKPSVYFGRWGIEYDVYLPLVRK